MTPSSRLAGPRPEGAWARTTPARPSVRTAAGRGDAGARAGRLGRVLTLASCFQAMTMQFISHRFPEDHDPTIGKAAAARTPRRGLAPAPDTLRNSVLSRFECLIQIYLPGGPQQCHYANGCLCCPQHRLCVSHL